MLIRFLKIEIKRTIFRWQTLIAFLLFIGIFIHTSILNKLDIPTTAQYSINLIHEKNNMFINYINAFAGRSNSYMALIFPLIILLIIGDSLFLDYNTSFLKFITCRIDLKKYIKLKILSISIISFSITFLFQIIAFLYSFIFSYKGLPTNLSIEKKVAPYLYSNMFVEHPFTYIFLFMIVICICAMAISVLSLISSSILNNIFAAISMPWIIYLFIGQLLMFIGPQTSIFYTMSPITMSSLFVFQRTTPSFSFVILYWIILWSILCISSYIVLKKKMNLK